VIVNRSAARVAWYRFRITFRRRLGVFGVIWLLFAGELSAVPDPAVPAASIARAALAAVVLANLVAALPGRSAGRTRAALVLRSE
jgi:hypothetical protein